MTKFRLIEDVAINSSDSIEIIKAGTTVFEANFSLVVDGSKVPGRLSDLVNLSVEDWYRTIYNHLTRRGEWDAANPVDAVNDAYQSAVNMEDFEEALLLNGTALKATAIENAVRTNGEQWKHLPDAIKQRVKETDYEGNALSSTISDFLKHDLEVPYEYQDTPEYAQALEDQAESEIDFRLERQELQDFEDSDY